jgi:tellurite resistance protein TerC
VGIKITIQKESDSHPEQNPLTTWLKKWMPVTEQYYGNQFFVKLDKKWYATPLLLTLLTVEFTDLIFAIDSIPAILAITLDPFIVYTSNIFAILGLRALFFALKASLKLFHYLHYALGAILSFVGFKMLISSWIHLPTTIALGFIVVALSLAVILSLIYPKREN